MKSLKKILLYATALFLVFGISSCSDDDNGEIIWKGSDASISAQDQTISQNKILIDKVDLDSDESAWLVVRKIQNEGEYSNKIANPIHLTGDKNDFTIQLEYNGSKEINLESGDEIILMLYRDEGNGDFDDSANTAEDKLLTNRDGDPITKTIVVTAPSIKISEQTVMDNGITYDSISVPENGWIVVHPGNEDGTPNSSEIVGKAYVAAGENKDVALHFDDDFVFTPGQTIYSHWHRDDPADEQFTYEEDSNTDMPDYFGFQEDPSIWTSSVIN